LDGDHLPAHGIGMERKGKGEFRKQKVRLVGVLAKKREKGANGARRGTPRKRLTEREICWIL